MKLIEIQNSDFTDVVNAALKTTEFKNLISTTLDVGGTAGTLSLVVDKKDWCSNFKLGELRLNIKYAPFLFSLHDDPKSLKNHTKLQSKKIDDDYRHLPEAIFFKWFSGSGIPCVRVTTGQWSGPRGIIKVPYAVIKCKKLIDPTSENIVDTFREAFKKVLTKPL